MTRLLCVARWPEDDQEHPDNPVEFELALHGESPEKGTGWVACDMIICMQTESGGSKRSLMNRRGNILVRDLRRLANDLQGLHERHLDSLTFVPVTPSFELWLSRLSDDQYRVVIWQDMADEFNGANDVLYHGARFITNRARLMGFARGLEMALDAL
jgi:hypothetical protein